MKAKGTHEGCIEQIQRLYADRLYTGKVIPVDEKGRIRIDDWEMSADVQSKITELWEKSDTETLPELGDLKGYKTDFLNLFGFGVEGIDYLKDVDENIEIDGLI